ncbi:MAG: amidohydrolase family protein [bacterium]|nr:amidohydrolase family protein [bacterium]
MAFDILIKNGSIVDGTGKRSAFKADVGIVGDKIFEIGNLAKTKAKTEIDATGMVVSPGFVDVQNHSDSYGSILNDNVLESMVRQGITTILMGQCGSSLAPLLKGSLSSIQKWASTSGTNINWSSMAEFLDTLVKRKTSINVATLTGHATIRRDFVGDSVRPLTPKEEIQVISLLKRSLTEGSYGLSIGLAYSHERLASEEEIIKLLTTTRFSNSVASFHLRNEGPEIYASLNEVLGFLHHAPVKAKISHLKMLGEKNTSSAEKLLRMIDVASRSGTNLSFDVYPYTASAIILYLLLPEWAIVGGKDDLIKKIKNSGTHEKIVRDIESKNYPYEKITIATSALGQLFVGKSLAQIARDQNTTGAEAILNLLLAARDQVTVFWNDIDETVFQELLKHPASIIASDGSGYNDEVKQRSAVPHPRSFGTTAKILERYVKEKKVLTIEEAVYKMSAKPAEWMGLKGRGVIAKDFFADIVVFDPNNIKDNSTFENPLKYPTGIKNVLVNGKIALNESGFSGVLAGQILKKGF